MVGEQLPAHGAAQQRRGERGDAGKIERLKSGERRRGPFVSALVRQDDRGRLRGATFSLFASPPAERDLRLSETVREMVIAAITVAPPSKPALGPDRVAARAVALRAVLAEARDVLSPAEQPLLGEWLDRLASSARPRGSAGGRRGRRAAKKSA